MALRHALLGLLSRSPSSGYDLLRTFNNSLAQVWPATQSQVYTELNRLESEHLVTVSSQGARGRKEYQTTPEGSDELHHWLLHGTPVQVRRSDMLLRVFFFDLMPGPPTIDYLDRVKALAAEQEEHLQKTRELVIDDPGPLSDNGQLALEYGIRLARMEQEWAEWAKTVFDSAETD